ncbi:serine protease [Paucibacter sp. AS339]|uniref:S1 family peptidase n=1 Tax=Paucibacter hankyongi TaxID=3133434 RepID=UPI0030AA23BE
MSKGALSCRRGILKLGFFVLSLFGASAPAIADLPELVLRSKPSVLLVGTFVETDRPRFTFRGTGFVVANGNLAFTNAHVLPETLGGDRDIRLVVQVRVGSREWSSRAAKVVSVDAAHDLALIRFDGPAVPSLKLAQTGLAREGGSIALMGFPLGGALGFSLVTHRGVISSVTPIALPPPAAQNLNERAIRQLREGSFDILQLDATAYPGNSGGPVFDVDSGEVVGIVNMVLVKGSKETALTHPSGISYAIPIQFASQMLLGL